MSYSAPDKNACTLTLPDGTFFDLSSLASTKDYEVDAEDMTYYINVCRGVVGELYKVDNPDTVGAYRKAHGAFGDFSLGQVNSTLWKSPMTDEPMMILDKGSACPLSPLHTASAAIRFTCAQSEFSAGKPKLIAALPPGDPKYYCSFFFEWPTHVACPTNPKSTLGGGHFVTFGMLLVIAFLTWFVGQTLWNRFYLSKSGMDIFPIPSLPSFGGRGSGGGSGGWSLPKPNITWGKGKSPARGFGWSRQRGYSNVRADEHDEEEHFAGRFSLDDDEEDARDLARGEIDSRGGGALGEETNAWRGQPSNGTAEQQGKVGVNQGLVDI